MIKIADVAYSRLRAPDLDRMEQFLTDFGLIRAARTKTALYMRGTGAAHHIHVTELGAPGFIGLAFHAQNGEDLARISKAEGASAVEHMDAPGGGQRVRLTDPNGITIEVVHGMEALEPLAVRANVMNTGDAGQARVGTRKSLVPGPAHVKRLGHFGIVAPDPAGTVAWYRGTLGFTGSDEIYVESEDNVMASFNRVDHGAEFVDHHTLLCVQGAAAGLNHLAFEVEDMDDLLIGHDHMKAAAAGTHMWGPGRHVIGAQVFDYWLCPWGHLHEHWTDSDMLNSDHVLARHPRGDGVVGSQWGPPPPQAFVDQVS
jgi:catechol 2,3-dioxygenase-like lactoylglutathione lyase family enzyme